MSLNDKNLGNAKGVDIHEGIAHPTSHSTSTKHTRAHFMEGPTKRRGASAERPDSDSYRQAKRNYKQTAGVIEARPGIIESTHIDPLDEHSLEIDEWQSTSTGTGSGSAAAQGTTSSTTGAVSSSTTMTGGAAQMAYGHLAGDEKAKEAGKEAVWAKGV